MVGQAAGIGADHEWRRQPITGFLPIGSWAPFLKSHPDQRFAAFLEWGIKWGFRIGFNPTSELRCKGLNLQSVHLNIETVDRYIKDEAAQGRLEQLSASVGHGVHRNPISIIPKPNQPGKFRLIVDLLSPQWWSVNDGINPKQCSLRYSSVEQAVLLAKSFGQGAKLDLKSAYRMVPVSPLDYHLLGLEWQGEVYQDRALPFCSNHFLSRGRWSGMQRRLDMGLLDSSLDVDSLQISSSLPSFGTPR